MEVREVRIRGGEEGEVKRKKGEQRMRGRGRRMGRGRRVYKERKG